MHNKVSCSDCCLSRFVAGLDQPVGCRLYNTIFSQSNPQCADTCPDFTLDPDSIVDDVYDYCERKEVLL